MVHKELNLNKFEIELNQNKFPIEDHLTNQQEQKQTHSKIQRKRNLISKKL